MSQGTGVDPARNAGGKREGKRGKRGGRKKSGLKIKPLPVK